jgi:hypothetical protein
MIPTAVRFMSTPLLIEVYTHLVGLSTYFDTYLDGSISGPVAKRLREILPTIDEMLAANKPAKSAKPAKEIHCQRG